MIYLADDDAAHIKIKLENNAFLHGRNLPAALLEALEMVSAQMQSGSGHKLDRIQIESAANRRSVMIRPQYNAFNREFGIRITIRTSNYKLLMGIGGSGTVLGLTRIQITFTALWMIIDVNFSILQEKSPYLISNDDMIENVFHISLQGRYLHVGKRRQPI